MKGYLTYLLRLNIKGVILIALCINCNFVHSGEYNMSVYDFFFYDNNAINHVVDKQGVISTKKVFQKSGIKAIFYLDSSFLVIAPNTTDVPKKTKINIDGLNIEINIADSSLFEKCSLNFNKIEYFVYDKDKLYFISSDKIQFALYEFALINNSIKKVASFTGEILSPTLAPSKDEIILFHDKMRGEAGLFLCSVDIDSGETNYIVNTPSKKCYFGDETRLRPIFSGNNMVIFYGWYGDENEPSTYYTKIDAVDSFFPLVNGVYYSYSDLSNRLCVGLKNGLYIINPDNPSEKLKILDKAGKCIISNDGNRLIFLDLLSDKLYLYNIENGTTSEPLFNEQMNGIQNIWWR